MIEDALQGEDPTLVAMAAYAAAIVALADLEEPLRELAERETSEYVLEFVQSALQSIEQNR